MVGWLVSIGSAWCGPYYAACIAVGNYEIARSQGENSTGALRGAFTAGAMAYVGQQANAQWRQGSWQSVATQATAGGIAADLNGGKFGHGFWAAGFNAFQQGPNSGAGYGQDLNSWGDYASSFGNYMVSSYTRDEMARFARKNGMTLTELNILLTLNSFAGNYISGSRYDAKTNEMTGFTSREAGVWGVLWDVNDTLLGYQGYLDASGFDYINSANAGSHISYCHSLGTLTCNTLVTKGFAPSANLNSLLFGNVAYGANQRMTQLGKWDIVNGFIFGRMFNWGATSTNCRSIDDALCHGGSNYR